MQFQLSWQTDAQPRAFQLDARRPVIIGRHKTCDIVLNERTVSRQHLQLVLEQEQINLQNLSNTNGVTVYTERLLDDHTPSPLYVNTTFKLGEIKFRVKQIVEDELGYELKLTANGRDYYADGDELTLIGRADTCDILLDSPTVSRKHAAIFLSNEQFYLRNLTENNPIPFFGKQRLNSGEQSRFNAQVHFRIGQTHIQAISPLTQQQPVREYKIKCHSCEQEVAHTVKDCPWCGVMLAAGHTIHS